MTDFYVVLAVLGLIAIVWGWTRMLMWFLQEDEQERNR